MSNDYNLRVLYGVIKQYIEWGLINTNFHNEIDQKMVLKELELIGHKKPFYVGTRFYLKYLIKSVLDLDELITLRDIVCIFYIDESRKWFWDGYGNLRDVQHYLHSKILFELRVTTSFGGLLEGVSGVES